MLKMLKNAMKDSLNRKIFSLWMPTFLSIVVIPLSNMFDSAFVGHLGTEQLAALSISTTIVSGITDLTQFLNFSTITGVSYNLGLKNPKKAMQLAINAIYFAVFLGFILFLVMLYKAHDILFLLGARDAVLDYGTTFIKWFSPNMLFVLISYAVSGILRGLQKVRLISVVSVATTILNILLNYVFIYILKMDIAGSALSSTIASFLGNLILLTATTIEIRKVTKSFLPTKIGFLEVFKTGVPLFIRSVSVWACIFVLVVLVNQSGAVSLAALAIIEAIWMFCMFGFDALAMSIQTLLAKEIGKGAFKTVDVILKRSVSLALFGSIIVAIIMLLLGSVGGFLFSNDPSVRLFVLFGIIESAILVPISGYAFTLDGVLMAGKNYLYLAKYATIATLSFTPVAFFLSFILPHSPLGMLILLFVFDSFFIGIRAVSSGLRIRTNIWYKALV
jgi:putative MATE family efflux protein